jgi:predicted metalloendopeptidase
MPCPSREVALCSRLFLAALASGWAALSGCEHPAAIPEERGRPAIGSWGFDPAAMDRSIDPGDDFFAYTSGTWLRNTPIPPDRPTWGSFNILQERCESDLREVIEAAAARQPPEGSAERKVVDYYRSYLDTAAIDRLGLEPAREDLDRIASARTHEDVARLMADPALPAGGPIDLGMDLDEKRPDAWILAVAQSGLGMPDRDYYLRPEPEFSSARAKYRDHVSTVLELCGCAADAGAADAIVALETRIARLHWPREKSRDRERTYNPRSRRELVALAPEFPWRPVLESFGAPAQDFFVVVQPDAVQALAKLFRDTPVATWRAYLAFHHLDAMADVLPERFDRAAFEFYGRVLGGTAEQRERWERAVTALSGSPFRAPLGEALGALYVRRHFSPQSREAMLQLVENLRAAYGLRILALPWMTAETKRAALRKLASLRVKIGHPETSRDYSGLEVRAGDAYGNRVRELVLARAREVERLSKPADRGEWAMVAHRVNAYYSATWNEIVFPAAILQPPFFDLHADPAVNYGGIGMVIGHEMGHAFDDQGAKSDEHGILRVWWNEQDRRNFQTLTDRLAEQYSRFEALPGLFVNGRFTLGENIGDLGGLEVALEAYRISLGGRASPTLDGFTGLQRFFLGFGQIWRALIRDEALRTQIVADPHSPARFRTNGTVRNMDEWYEAFDVQPGAGLYLEPGDRVRIW